MSAEVALAMVSSSSKVAGLRARASQRRIAFHDSAYRTLRDAIVRGELTPGAQIPEEGLAERLGVSRTPLREAVNKLQAEGLVRRAANRRLFVTPVSIEEARDVYSVRIALEDLALTEAAARVTAELMEELLQSLDRMEKAEKSRQVDVAEGGRSFHDILYHASANSINADILQRLQVKVDRYRYIGTGGGRRRQRQAVDEHRAIYEALRRGDVEAARRALREHLEHARDEALKVLQPEQAPRVLNVPDSACSTSAPASIVR